jgi:hypothetical protein
MLALLERVRQLAPGTHRLEVLPGIVEAYDQAGRRLIRVHVGRWVRAAG